MLFALLIGWTSRWTVFESKSLANNRLNKLTFFQDLQIKRGRILAADGTVLARSVPAGGGTWNRAYPTGSLFSQAIGYDVAAQGSAAGLERSRGDALRGNQGGLKSVFGQLSSHPVGNDVVTTLDPAAQKLALAAAERTDRFDRRARPAHRRDQGDGLAPRLRRQRPDAVRTARSGRRRSIAPRSPAIRPVRRSRW